MKPSCLLALAALWAGPVYAEIYKQVDAGGHVTYSSTPMPGAKKLDLGLPSEARPVERGVSVPPSSFPRVDARTQRGRDDVRRKILEEELATEEGLLIEARRDTKPTAHADVSLHEKNVKALRTELANLK
ncbi:MAG: DUF4124 domain-containing protein [Nitrosomonadales bacterium]|nr:DUF4124 domain-containing protein [Nitrosomonadales bacterium]